MSHRTRAAPTALAGAILSSLLAQGAFAAEASDVVYLKSQTPLGAPRTLTGEIVDYTGRELRLRGATQRERVIPAGQIERVETKVSPEQLAGDAQFAKRDFSHAFEEYRRALAASREPRNWVRRQILAQVVWCQRNLGQADQAGEYFLILLASDPYTRLFDCIPLAWTNEAPPPAAARKAAAWLESTNPAAELIGASLLLASDARPRAAEHLKRLASDPDNRIAWLAQTQLWRIALDGADSAQLHRWAAAIDAADPALAAGAHFLVGSALARTAPEEAALVLMKVPILYEREDRLAAAALLAAGECLEKIGRARQSAGLYRELVARHGQAPEASQARRRLASLEAAREN